MVQLTKLNLKATGVTDASVATLLQFQELSDLNVAGTQFTDEGFKQFAQLPKLKKLNVANTSIGFDVVDELNARDGLEVVEYEN